jgi:glycosyltransferase involved in cell wall biosynthesis
VRVLHVLPTAVPRGAQRYAALLADGLRGPGDEHLLLTLFASAEGSVPVDVGGRVPDGRVRRLWADPRAVRELRAAVRRLQPDVLVAHGLEPMKYAALLPTDRPAVVCLAIGTTPEAARRGWRGGAYRRALRAADVVAGVSRDVQAELAGAFGRPDALLLRNGRRVADFEVRHRPQPDVPMLLFVGRLVPGKRPELFVDAVQAARASGAHVSARIVGGGPLEESLEGAAARAGVALLGERTDVPRLLADADLFVFPSLPEGEGLPGVLIEAALAGLPIVSTDVPGARDVVIDGETGTLVPPDDDRAFQVAVRALVGDAGRRAAMGRAARQHAAAEFDLDSTLAAWRAALTRAARGRADRRPRRTPAST